MFDLVWRRSSRCSTATNCVEVAWTRSSRCEAGHCVEVQTYPNAVYVRDSKLGHASPVLHYTAGEWQQLLAQAKAEEMPDDLNLRLGEKLWEWERNGSMLKFTDDEVDAFMNGALDGEFDLPVVTHAG